MKYGSICSGVEAATVAWHSLGWEPRWFSEIDKFPSAVLRHHYPKIPNLGNMSKFKEWNNDPIDLLVGGTPCQSFSVAGLRRGLNDPRGNLMLTYLAIAAKYKPRWLVWENVPGVLSSNRGRDFGTFLGALGKLGYGFAYRMLDAQYFGVAQRRRRVFVVGYLGDWRRAAAVLFERDSLSGHPAPSRQTEQDVAPTVTRGPPFSRTGNERVEAEALVTGYTPSSFGTYKEGAGTIRAAGGDLGGGSETLVYVEDVANCLQTTANDYSRADGFNMIAFPAEMSGTQSASTPNLSPTLSVGHTTAVSQNLQVRRLTPKECERLQGFPDNYTQIPWRDRPAIFCPDGPRYKAMGNSMAVPVMRWIGERIQKAEAF